MFGSRGSAGRIRLRKVPGVEGYMVTDRGDVYGPSGLPLVAVNGVGVNIGGRRVKVAELVARAFLENAEGRKWVRHRNGDVRDNRLENLEWSDVKEEMRRGRKPAERWCRAWSLDGELMGVWRNATEGALAMGVDVAKVRNALSGRQKQAGGYLWRWGQ